MNKELSFIMKYKQFDYHCMGNQLVTLKSILGINF